MGAFLADGGKLFTLSELQICVYKMGRGSMGGVPEQLESNKIRHSKYCATHLEVITMGLTFSQGEGSMNP